MTQAPMIAAPSSLEVVRQLYDAFVRGDATAIMALLADDLEWYEAENFMLSDLDPYRMPVAVAEGVFARLASDVRDYEASPDELFDAGNVIVGIGRSKGVLASTGRSFDAQYAHIWRVRDGEIVDFQQVIDTLCVWRAQQAVS